MIARDCDDVLAHCLASAKPYVDDIVIADTGSRDGTREIALAFGARVVDFTPNTHPHYFFVDCPESFPCPIPGPFSGDVGLADFAEARNFAFEHAAYDHVLWLDADDVLVGGDCLPNLVERMRTQALDAFMVNYDYDTNALGQITCKLMRERLVRRRPEARWVGAVHEAFVPTGRAAVADQVNVRHMRHLRVNPRIIPNRNYKILMRQLHAERVAGKIEPRTLFYLGSEAMFLDPVQAKWALREYLKVSIWSEERALARCKLGKLAEAAGDYSEAFECYSGAYMDVPTLPDGLFGLMRVAHHAREWDKCIRFAEKAFACGNPPTLLMSFLEDRLHAHGYYSEALAAVGRAAEAAEACRAGLQLDPQNETLRAQLATVPPTPPAALPAPTPTARVALDGALRVAIWTGPSWEPWTPQSLLARGMGGAETAAWMIAKAIRDLGHKVCLYVDHSKPEPCEGVEVKSYSTLGDAQDVLVASRDPFILNHVARAKLLWVHDVHCGPASPQVHRHLLMADRILCLSNWHKAIFLEQYPFIHEMQVQVTRNGIDPARFPVGGPPRANRLLYTSSPDRGLDVMLDVFPQIRARVPDAELHVYYGFESWEAAIRKRGDSSAPKLIAWYKRRLVETAGVTAHGRVNQATLAAAFRAAKVWAYPAEFPETSCIGAMEAQAAGCFAVTTRMAAIGETLKHGVLLAPPNTSPIYQARFVEEVVHALTDEPYRQRVAEAGRNYAHANLSWAALARDWVELFIQLIRARERGELPRFSDGLPEVP